MADFTNTIEVLGDDALIDSIIDRTITEFKDDMVTTIGQYAFNNCANLETVYCPEVLTLEANAFSGCANLRDVRIDKVTKLNGYDVFSYCPKLPSVMIFPKVTTVTGYNVFRATETLKVLDFPVLESINRPCGMWFLSSGIVAFVIRNTKTVCTLSDDIFSGCPNIKDGGTGYIYVPSVLVDDYKAATNWSKYANQIRAIEDWTIYCNNITLSASTLTFNGYENKTITATLTPTNCVITDVEWSSDNPEVATVSNGIVRSRNNGTATITAKSGICSESCVVTVTGIEEGTYPMLYSLPNATTFNGTSDYIDTGVQLFDTPKDFTIIVSATFVNLGSNICLLHCMNEASPYPGLSVDGNSGVRICYTGSSTSLGAPTNLSAMALRYVGGVLESIRYKNTSGEILSATVNSAAKYTIVTQTLLLGAYQTTNGTKGRYFNGTIYSLDVYEAALTDDEIAARLA